MRNVIIALGLSVTVVLGPLVHPAQASWVSANCHGTYVTDHYVRRSDAQAYSAVAAGEGYEWGGGCWNNNNRDDTPGQPNSGGEGPDCSGFTFKTWELRNATGQSGFTYWEALYNVHGPYATYDFHAPVGSDPFFRLPDKDATTTMYMDAFAKNGHVGMLYVDSGAPDGTDLIIEALGDAAGTGKFYESYRSQSEYVAVRREGWTPDCWPNCQHPARPVVVMP